MSLALFLGARTIDTAIGGGAMTVLGVISLLRRRAYARMTMQRLRRRLPGLARTRIEATLTVCVAVAAVVFISAGLFAIIGLLIG